MDKLTDYDRLVISYASNLPQILNEDTNRAIILLVNYPLKPKLVKLYRRAKSRSERMGILMSHIKSIMSQIGVPNCVLKSISNANKMYRYWSKDSDVNGEEEFHDIIKKCKTKRMDSLKIALEISGEIIKDLFKRKIIAVPKGFMDGVGVMYFDYNGNPDEFKWKHLV
jgi:hypothetical protein